MLSSFGCVSSPSGPNASSSKKHHVVDAAVEELLVRRPLLLVGGEHGAGLARLPRVDDVDRPLAQAAAVVGPDEARNDDEPVAMVGGHLILIEHDRIVPGGLAAVARSLAS